MPQKMIAGLPASSFLRRYWQKQPLLAAGALSRYERFITRDMLFSLAARDDLQSRLVVRTGSRWKVTHGPFEPGRLERLPARGWTLLVQCVNHVLPAAQNLLLEFNFIPYARLDDVMVSYAPPGGGVGPHFDSYDVFLVQISGARRWRLSKQRDLLLVENAPLKLLRNFRAGEQHDVAPGDVLYLPPRMAHDGIAIDHCITASVGFRTPDAQEFGLHFLEFLGEHLRLSGTYRDPGLQACKRPAQIGDDMLQRVRRMLGRISWTNRDVLRFLGEYLTEPRPHVFFTPPRRPLGLRAFVSRAEKHGLRLDLRTQMLFHGRSVFVNGEYHRLAASCAALVTQLADQRALAPRLELSSEAQALLYPWYRAGYIEAGSAK